MRLSTILLMILLLFIVCYANAQITIKEMLKSGMQYQSLYTGTINRDPIRIDTIKSYLLVTMPMPECVGDCLMIKQIVGYEVIKHDVYLIEWFYLDDKKKPLSKNINVWMSKPVKK